MSLFKDRSFLAASLAHFVVDMLNSQRPLLLAIMSASLGLSNTLIGGLSTIYSLAGSLTQPVFGQAADRIGSRWIAAGGVMWMVIAFSLALIVPGHSALIFLMLAALGSGAFHPAGASEATKRGQAHLSRMEVTATSFFFLFGQSGLFLGPILGGPLLDRFGPIGLIALVAAAIPAGLFAAYQLPTADRPSSAPESLAHSQSRQSGAAHGALGAFILLIVLRSSAQMTMISFLPKFLSDLGLRPAAYGAIAALFMGGGAVGGVAGGWLSDRHGKRKLMMWTLGLAAIPIALFSQTVQVGWLIVLSVLSGAFIGASHSVIVVLAQRRLPGRMGAASGLVLGLTFASGSLGTLLSGVLADRNGFSFVFLMLAVFLAIASLLAASVPREPVSNEPSISLIAPPEGA